jgi:capsular polysaccharide biosynthesis protein
MGTGQQAEQDAVTKLNKMLEISTEKGTDLVLVEVYSPIPREAADLANAVAASYEQCRKDYEKVKNENAIQALQLELDNQDKKVEEHRVSMLAIMKKYRIVDFEATNGGWKGAKGGVGNPSNEAQEMSAQQRLAEYRAETTKYETELRAVLQAATSEETLAVMEALNQDPVVIRELRQGLASATKAGSAEGIQTALKAITTAGETLQRTMETKVKLAKNIAQDLAQAHAVQQDDMLGDRARQSEYVMAKLGYQQESALMNDMKEHIMKQKVDLAMPMLPVRIHENAYPNAKVVRPNGEMLLATGSGIALMLGLALAFILEYGRRD